MAKVTFQFSRVLIIAVAVIVLTVIAIYGLGIQNTLNDMMLSDSMETEPVPM